MIWPRPEQAGTPGGTRTPGPLLRRQLLYPPELQAHMERVMGIEPTRPAWKAGILPLNYTRMVLPLTSANGYYHIFAGLSMVFEKFNSNLDQAKNRVPFPNTKSGREPCFARAGLNSVVLGFAGRRFICYFAQQSTAFRRNWAQPGRSRSVILPCCQVRTASAAFSAPAFQ